MLALTPVQELAEQERVLAGEQVVQVRTPQLLLDATHASTDGSATVHQELMPLS